MKTKLIVVAGLLAATGLSQGAITFVGTFVSGLGALAPLNSLTLLVVDTPANGFLGNPAFTGDLSALDDPKLAVANCSTDLGATFGGDLVLGRLKVTSAGALPGSFTNIENGLTTQGFGFALVWFPGLTDTYTGNVPAGTAYGITRGLDWIMPAANTGQSYTISTSDAGGDTSFYRVTVASGVATNDLFTTSSGANFASVPETSAALLGALGALGLLRRRR